MKKLRYISKSAVKNLLLCIFACCFIYMLFTPCRHYAAIRAIKDYRENPAEIGRESSVNAFEGEDEEILNRWFDSFTVKGRQDDLPVTCSAEVVIWFESKNYTSTVVCSENPGYLYMCVYRKSDGKDFYRFLLSHDEELYSKVWKIISEVKR